MNKPTPNDEAHPNGADPDNEGEARIGRILRKTQREVAARDILTFSLGRAWSVLLIVGATFVVIADQWAKNTGNSDTDSS